MIRRILTVDGDQPILKQKSAPMAAVDDDLRRLMDDMLETMYAAPGIGLAAIQVGVVKRVIVMDLAKDEEPPAPRYFVNPEVVWSSEEMFAYEEGCLSVPEIFDEVVRPNRVKLHYLDYDGSRSRRRPRASMPSASSTRSTTSTASSSSTISPA